MTLRQACQCTDSDCAGDGSHDFNPDGQCHNEATHTVEASRTMRAETRENGGIDVDVEFELHLCDACYEHHQAVAR
jgi:hypothetical protein